MSISSPLEIAPKTGNSMEQVSPLTVASTISVCRFGATTKGRLGTGPVVGVA
jgi:hypothetical protein